MRTIESLLENGDLHKKNGGCLLPIHHKISNMQNKKVKLEAREEWTLNEAV